MIVMDYVDGTTLSNNVLSAVNYEQLQRAIDRLHAQSLVFGDLRPQNIILSKATGRVMLVDFDFCGLDVARYSFDLNTQLDWVLVLNRYEEGP